MKIQLTESELRHIVNESVKRLLKESGGLCLGNIKFNKYEELVEKLIKEGYVPEEQGDTLFNDLEDISYEFPIEGTFNWWYLPARLWGPPEDCHPEENEIELEDFDTTAFEDAIMELSYLSDEAKTVIMNFVNEWAENVDVGDWTIYPNDD